MEGYQLNKDYKVSQVFIGEINETVIIVDDFLHNLEPVYQFASEQPTSSLLAAMAHSTQANEMKCLRPTTELLSS